MATQKYGVSPWGAYFVETLFSHFDKGRLDRGKSYANSGKVAKLEIARGELHARVRGNYQPWYDVQIGFPLFTDEEAAKILAHLGNAERAAIAAGELPMSVVEELAADGLDVIPRDWADLTRRCSCPDIGDPCKHMAAVYFAFSREIDQNPRSLLELRGISLDLDASGSDEVMFEPPFALKMARSGVESATVDSLAADYAPQFSLQGSMLGLILALLRPSPAFAGFDVKSELAAFHHESTRRVHGQLLVAEKLISETTLSESTFDISEADLDTLSSEHPVSGTVGLSLLDAIPHFLSAEDARGTPGYRFLFHLSRLFFQIVTTHAFVPVVDKGKNDFGIAWQPLSSVAEVREAMASLEPICPHLIRMEKGGFADASSTVQALLVRLCTSYAVSLGVGLDRGADVVRRAFFNGLRVDDTRMEWKSSAKAIQAWLAVLWISRAAYRYRFVLTAVETSLALRVDIQERTEAEGGEWISLCDAAKRSDGASALRTAVVLESYLPELKMLKSLRQVIVDEDSLTRFLAEARDVLRRLDVDVQVPRGLERALRPRLAVRATTKGAGSVEGSFSLDQMLEYERTFSLGDEELTREDLERLLAEARKVVRFKDGYLLLDPEEIRRLLKAAEAELGPGDVVAAYLENPTFFSAPAKDMLAGLFSEKAQAVPAGLKADFRHYQSRGYSWLWNKIRSGFGCLLADDMGLGKTLQAIAVLLRLKEERMLEHACLAVLPASLITNWEREIEKFAPSLAVHRYYGPRRVLKEAHDVYLTSYDTLIRDEEKLAARTWSLLILDEVHCLKNSAALRSRALAKIPRARVLALSGTPVENRLEDMRSIFDHVYPGYLGSAVEFRRRWRIPIELHRNAEVAAEFKRITSPFILRRMKTDPDIAPDLPGKILCDERAVLTKEQSALYSVILDEMAAKAFAVDEAHARGALVLKMMTALKQVCNHPRAYDGISPGEASLSGKAMLLVELLRSIMESREKVLVFSQYVGTLELLKHIIRNELDEEVLMFHGGLDGETRTRLVDRFQTDAAAKIFLISLKAGGVGLNLTAASRVIHYDLWFNPAVEDQATDRAFRIGQTRKVFVHRLMCVGTFEEKIDKLIQSRRELAQMSVETGESWLSDLSGEDLKALFSRS